MLLVRKLVFYLFVVAYVVICPLTIAYALGYLVRPGAEQGLVKTGLIYLSTSPPGASVYVGRRRYTQRTPTSLRGVLPGTYPITVALKGHRVWKRRVAVEAGHATAFDHILLLPDVLRQHVLVSDRCEELLASTDAHLLVVRCGPLLRDLRLYHRREATLLPLRVPGVAWQDARIREAVTMRDGAGLVLSVASREGPRWVWVDAERAPEVFLDLTPLVPDPVAEIQWDPRESHLLFVRSPDRLIRVDVERGTSTLVAAEALRGVGMFRKWLYVVSREGTIERRDAGGKTVEVVLDDPAARALFQQGRFRVVVCDEDTIFFIGERGELLSTQPPYLLLKHGVRDVAWDPLQERLLVRQRERLGVLEPPDRGLPKDVLARPGIRWIFTDGSDLRQAFWVYDGSHVLIRDGEEVALLERPIGDHPPVIQTLVRVQPRSDVRVVEPAGTLYYLDHPSGHLRALEVFPTHEVVTLPFREP